MHELAERERLDLVMTDEAVLATNIFYIASAAAAA